jgi:hypothetical protein
MSSDHGTFLSQASPSTTPQKTPKVTLEKEAIFELFDAAAFDDNYDGLTYPSPIALQNHVEHTRRKCPELFSQQHDHQNTNDDSSSEFNTMDGL